MQIKHMMHNITPQLLSTLMPRPGQQHLMRPTLWRTNKKFKV